MKIFALVQLCSATLGVEQTNEEYNKRNEQDISGIKGMNTYGRAVLCLLYLMWVGHKYHAGLDKP